MLDTSDRDIFQSGYDPSMGTTGFSVDVGDTVPALVLSFDKTRRAFIITNAGAAAVYCSLTTEVSLNQYSFKLSAGKFFSMDHYGGIVTAICGQGNATELYITDIH